MEVSRRQFLGLILAAGVAPAIVRASSLMAIVPVERTIYVPASGPVILVPEHVTVNYSGAGVLSSLDRSLMVRAELDEYLRSPRFLHRGRIREVAYSEDVIHRDALLPHSGCILRDEGNSGADTIWHARANFLREVRVREDIA